MSTKLNTYTIGLKNMTTKINQNESGGCPAEMLLKALTGKWKPQIFRIAVNGPFRFNSLIKQLEGANKQTVASALKSLEEHDFLEKKTISLKPLKTEYVLTQKGKSVIPIFEQLEFIS